MYILNRLNLFVLFGLLFSAPILSLISITVANSAEDVLKQNINKSTTLRPMPESCSNSQIKKYVDKLGTLELKDSEFESLVKCDSKAIPALEIALNNSNNGNSDMRASAAYVLGEISVYNRNKIAYKIIENSRSSEKDVQVLAVLKSYDSYIDFVDVPDKDSCHDFPAGCHMNAHTSEIIVEIIRIKSQRRSSPIICALPGIRNIFPRCK
jgi:hypothetical protein